jgi:hypothetical protein
MHTRIRLLGALLLALALAGCLGQPGLPTDQPGINPPIVPTPLPGGPPAATRLTRGPYLQDVTATEATVVWRTADAVAGTLLLTADAGGDPRTLAEPAAGTDHLLRLTGLQAGTAYHYELHAGGPLGSAHPLHTAPLAGAATPFRFLVWGDSGCACPAQMAVAAQMQPHTPDLMLHTGDMIYEGGEAAGYDPRFFVPYADLLARAPIYPSLGNHDVVTQNGAPWLQIFHLPNNAGSADTPRYYSYNWGNTHFMALDSEQDYGPTSPQYAWLLGDLQSAAFHGATWHIAYFHRPPYSSGYGHGSEYSLREAWSPLFERFGVDLVVNGHEHNYERTLPRQDYPPPDGSAGHPVTYIVTGGGGKQLYNVGRKQWTAASSMVYHFLEVRVDGSQLTVEAIDEKGAIFDTVQLHH